MDQKSYAVRSYLDEPKTPEEIRNEIDATRAALDRTVTEIEHRLQPRYLYEEAKSAAAGQMRRATGAARAAARSAAEQAVTFGYRTADRVRQSPTTTIGTAVGVVAALMLSWRGVQRMRRGRRVSGRMPAGFSTRPADRVQPVTNRNPRRRTRALGIVAAALGACGTYAARSRMR